MSILVSVVIPCFNSARWIVETLQSAVAQPLDEIEVIAVDDGSTDNTSEIIRERFSLVRLIETDHRGVSHARNLGMSVAHGRFIQFLDADDLLAPNKISKQLAALQKAGADVAYGDWNRLNANGSGAFQEGNTVTRQMETPFDIALFTDFWCPLAAYLFRQEIVNKVGSWNTQLPVIQDARFTLDCVLQGAKFIYTPGVVASYRAHQKGSLSTGNSLASLADQLLNAQQIEHWWTAHGGLSDIRLEALSKVYGHVARASYESDAEMFNQACGALERLNPGYVPATPRSLAIVSRVTGYRKAESIALGYRRAKRIFTTA